MKATQVLSHEPGERLSWCDVPDPIPGPGEALVDVCATALNRADLMQRAGRYPPPPGAPDILGLEMAGHVAAVGEDVERWRPGDPVCALLNGGGYAERVTVPKQLLMPIPGGWSCAQAAAMPEAFLTVFANIFMEAGFERGDTVLVHGGASGVGTAAIQLVRAAGGHVLVTVGSDVKAARCRELGAELAVNYRTEDFTARVMAYTDGAGADIILDIVGGPYLAANLKLLKVKGRLVVISTLGGSRAETDLGVLLSRRLRLIGSVLRSRSLEEKAKIVQAFRARFWSDLEEGRIRPVIDSIYPIQQAEQAHQRMAENRNVGKIVLQVR